MKIDKVPQLDTVHLVTLNPVDREDLLKAYLTLRDSNGPVRGRDVRVIMQLACELLDNEVPD